ncbi:RNase III inhibitor [Clostridia bacterium]|nr:RNase III inhibitor [Clostridia bacterium]
MTFEIVNGDITTIGTEAVVNAANSALQCGGGVCGAIFSAAGERELQQECDKLGWCEPGNAVITSGYALSKYVIHAVGPIWYGGDHGEESLLRSCYTNSLKLAKEHGVKSIAFPLISSGIYGYPQEEAEAVATGAINEFLKGNDDCDMKVYLVKFS